MNKELYHEILNLSVTVFKDVEYKELILLIQSQKFNELRLMSVKQGEFLTAIESFKHNDSVIQTQLKFANRLEDIFTELYISNLTKVAM